MRDLVIRDGERRAQRLVRAKRKIVDARIPFRVPDREAILGSIKEFLGTGR